MTSERGYGEEELGVELMVVVVVEAARGPGRGWRRAVSQGSRSGGVQQKEAASQLPAGHCPAPDPSVCVLMGRWTAAGQATAS